LNFAGRGLKTLVLLLASPILVFPSFIYYLFRKDPENVPDRKGYRTFTLST